MIDAARLFAELEQEGLGSWERELAPLIAGRLAPSAHGDLPAWQAAVEALPRFERRPGTLDAPAVGTADATFDAATRERVRRALLALVPWRKGPFDVGGVRVDAEWRSDLKWDRVAATMSPLAGRRVLDVGAGNGYYALRMLGAGARLVIGIDPTLVYLMQFEAVTRCIAPVPAWVLPLRMAELPPAGTFDTAFSMGVLYHQRDPIEHLRQLRGALRPGGELVLETLVLPGDAAYARTPEDRYARMRNVWLLPTPPELVTWLSRTGFRDVRLADETVTTVDEQRSTEWMPYESLADALEPDDPSRTVEGWPAPRRAIVTACAPG